MEGHRDTQVGNFGRRDTDTRTIERWTTRFRAFHTGPTHKLHNTAGSHSFARSRKKSGNCAPQHRHKLSAHPRNLNTKQAEKQKQHLANSGEAAGLARS